MSTSDTNLDVAQHYYNNRKRKKNVDDSVLDAHVSNGYFDYFFVKK